MAKINGIRSGDENVIIIMDHYKNALGVLQNVISATCTEELNGAYTLEFEAVLDPDLLSKITNDVIFVWATQHFDIARYTKTLGENGMYIIQVEAEHFSYRLNKEQYNTNDIFEMTDSMTNIMLKILQSTDIQFYPPVGLDQTPMKYYVEENTSRRKLLMDFIDLTGYDIAYESQPQYAVTIMQHRGNSEITTIVPGYNLRSVTQTVDVRQFDEFGKPSTVYEILPDFSIDSNYQLGDEVLIIDSILGINDKLRIISKSVNPYDRAETRLKLGTLIRPVVFSLMTESRSLTFDNGTVKSIGSNSMFNNCQAVGIEAPIRILDERINTAIKARPEIPFFEDEYAKYYYRIIDGVIEIINIETNMKNLVIIETIEGLPVERFAAGAFAGAATLETVTLPDSAKIIDNSAFNNLPNLTKISVNSVNTAFAADVSGILYSKDMTTLIRIPIKAVISSNYTIAKKVTKIEGYAFYGLNISSVYCTTGTDSQITEIQDFAFADCRNLTTVFINSVRGQPPALETNTFADCPLLSEVYYYTIVSGGGVINNIYTKLTSLSLPETIDGFPVERLDAGVFYSAESLENIVIPKTTKVIDSTAFNTLTNLRTIDVDAKSISFASDGGLLYTKDMKTLVRVPNNAYNFTFAVTVTKIGAYAFSGAKLESITIPLAVTSIGDYAFANCLSLITVIIERQNISLGADVFLNCPILNQ